MKKLALAFSSKDRCSLTNQSLPRVANRGIQLFWNDGSTADDGKYLHQAGYPDGYDGITRTRVTGGPDAAIVFALSQMLSGSSARESADYFGLLESDVLLDPDWIEPTMALFDNAEGLPVGAVSARSYVDRVMIQRDGYAVCHNVGGGHVIFTREAAQIILNNYRTGWWPENRATFSQLSGLDIGKFAAFGFNDQFVTADWSWDTILAAHGLATVALTPSYATMIGQAPSLEEQGLRLVQSEVEERRNENAFYEMRAGLIAIRDGGVAIGPVDHLLRARNGYIIFPHHAAKHRGIFHGNWTTCWSQGFGPFNYMAGTGASFSIPLFGPCAFHVHGGAIKLTDEATGFNTDIDLSGSADPVTIPVPRDMQTGIIYIKFSQGACLAGIETVHPQPVWKDVAFDYSKLPEVG